MFVLTYLKVCCVSLHFFLLFFAHHFAQIILTPPGFARDYVPRSEAPLAPEPTVAYNTSYGPSPSTRYDGNEFVYPPSRKAPTSEYRPSMEDRMTHETASVGDHSGFDGNTTRSNTLLNKPGGSRSHEDAEGVPYELMPTRPLPVHTRPRTASSTAIPPTTPKPSHQRSNSSNYPPSPSTPTAKSRPTVLRKDSKPGSISTIPGMSSAPNDPTKAQVKTRSVRAGSTSSHMTTTTTTLPVGRPHTPIAKRPDPLNTTGTGFKYESSSYILDPPLLSSQTHSRTNSHTRTISASKSPTVPFPSHSPTTPRAGMHPSSNHPNINVAGRTEEFNERPVPYLDDLPPVQPPWWDRKPIDRPVLEPYYRYCSRDEFVKPPRSHHCRICNTVRIPFGFIFS